MGKVISIFGIVQDVLGYVLEVLKLIKKRKPEIPLEKKE